MAESTENVALTYDERKEVCVCVVPDWLGRNHDAACNEHAREVERIIAAREDAVRREALGVAALLLRKVADYWDGRPLSLHGSHIYSDLLDVLRAIEADSRIRPVERTGSEAQ